MIVPVVVADNCQPAFSVNDLGKGYKLNVGQVDSSLTRRIFKTDGSTCEYVPITQSHAKCKCIDSVEDVKDSLGVQGALAVSFGPFISAGSGGKYLQETLSSKTQKVMMYHARHSIYAREMTKYEPEDDVAPLLNRLEDASQLSESHGTAFVSKVHFGMLLSVKYTFTASEETDICEVSAKLNGKLGGLVPAGHVPVSIGFKEEFGHSAGSRGKRGHVHTKIEVKASGVNLHLPAEPTSEDVEKLVREFNAKAKEKTDEVHKELNLAHEKGRELRAMAGLTPVCLELQSLAVHATSLSRDQVAQLEKKMDALAPVFHAALEWSAKLGIAKTEVKGKCTTAELTCKVFDPFCQAMDADKTALERKLEECLKFRQLPLAELLKSPVPELFPSDGSEDVRRLRGLVGNGFTELSELSRLKSFVGLDETLWGDVGELKWSGFIVKGKPGLNGNRCYGSGLLEGREALYSGEFCEGMPHGRGYMKFARGDAYDGLWQNGWPHGQGVYTCASGERQWRHLSTSTCKD